MHDDPIDLIVDTKIRGAEPRPVVLRRKVAVRVHLAGGSTIGGEFYASAEPTGSAREPILERLNDAAERYVPIADGTRHVLANKSSILYVESKELDARPAGGAAGAHVFHVELTLDSGLSLEGTIETDVTALHYRTLDHVNGHAGRFLRLVGPRSVLYVNHDHVVSLVDRQD